MHTALKHDKIMEGGPADYALVEAEAEKVAKEAVKALKESRRQYARPFDDQASTVVKPPGKPRFGNKKTIGRPFGNSSLNQENGSEKVRIN